MDIIKLLPDSVANQIAAGEVVQRPASVVKELVENSVDAGATEIRIVIRDAGKTLIQVSDNGSGMSEMDARMAFERHATSKIRQAADMFRLHSMGFRGEALPSICAISEVELKTRQEDSVLGTRLIIEGSKVKIQEPVAAETGTIISVKKLFYNVPARRKFLKSDSIELSNIMREFERLALVNNKLRMSIDTGSRVMELRPGTMRQRIEEIWKNTLKSDHLLPVDIDTSLVKIEGFVSRPEFARRRNPLQYLIVNGRNMRHPYFHKAVAACYDNLIAPGTQPCYFLKFTVDPGSIDVNISPTKNDIKFENEAEIWPILQSAVRTSLGKFSAVPSIDFNSDALEIQPLHQGEMPKAPDMSWQSDYNPFEDSKPRQPHVDVRYRPTPVSANWESLYQGTETPRNDRPSAELPSQAGQDMALFSEREIRDAAPSICLQYRNKYIIATYGTDLMIIDQHRAQVKILYEDYLNRGANELVSQRLMFPEQISFDNAQMAVLAGVKEELERIGFELEYVSDNNWQINSAPTLVKPEHIRDVLLSFLDSVSEDNENYGNEMVSHASLREKFALVMARSSAIRGGVKLSTHEMEDIVGRLFGLSDPAYTPNGNPIYRVLTENEINSMFGSKD